LICRLAPRTESSARQTINRPIIQRVWLLTLGRAPGIGGHNNEHLVVWKWGSCRCNRLERTIARISETGGSRPGRAREGTGRCFWMRACCPVHSYHFQGASGARSIRAASPRARSSRRRHVPVTKHSFARGSCAVLDDFWAHSTALRADSLLLASLDFRL